MQKDFDKWNGLKKEIDLSNNEPDKFPKEGEVWMSNLGENIGFEQNGSGDNFSRPVLIIKKFNNKMFWAIPLSTKQKKFDFYFNYTDVNDQKVSAILAQMRLISIKRLKRKLYELEHKRVLEVKNSLKSFL
ncbi:MAG: type II toxin-antitoxin system PemK/MazF family toxin [Candidatus Paceibacterota bacterium]|jgi:mRNA interferase MazF